MHDNIIKEATKMFENMDGMCRLFILYELVFKEVKMSYNDLEKVTTT